jgi:hypothetical protein
MLTAIYAARNIAGEKNDVWSVNTEMEYHEEVRTPRSATMGDRLVPTRLEPAAQKAEADEIIATVFGRLDPLAMGTAIGAVSGLVLFIATIVLLLEGGPVVGPTLSLLKNYLIGFEVTWKGALIGLVQAGLIGFALGYLGARFGNIGIAAYAHSIRRRAEAQANTDLLDKV